jgi:hypothetical protein
MKKLLAFVLFLFVVAAYSACGGYSAPSEPAPEPGNVTQTPGAERTPTPPRY